MDKLEKSKQGELRKLTDARLVAKLTQAGIPIDEVEALDRNSMLDKWAEIIIAGKDVAIKTGVATGSASGYDVELERQKLKFQMKQWEDERAERQAQRETDKLNRNIIRASVNVVTRSQAKAQPLPSIITESIDNEIMSKDTNTDGTMLNRNNTDIDNDIFIDVDVVKLPDIESESAITNAREFASEQQRDETLSCAWKLARRDKSGYVIKDELLYHTEKRCGQIFDALCVPHSRRLGIMNLAHNNSHFGIRHTKERIISSGLWWPTIAADTQKWVTECNECQLRARKTWKDRVPIHGTIRDTDVWHYFYMDCAGPIVPNANLRYNYVLVLIDSCSRYPFAYPLRTLSAKNVCNALMCMFQTTGIPIGMTIASDNGSNFRAALTRELMSCLGVSPVFSTPYHPVSVVERSIQTLKNTIAKMAYDHKDSWVNYLGPSLWAIRSTVNETVGCPPHLLVFGHMPRGPLSILNDTWTGKADIPANVSRSTVEYLDDLRSRLETAQNYATLCAEHEQQRHVAHYNLKAQDKSFSVGDSCLILQPESTSSHALRRWKGPAKIIRIMSPYSYMVDYNGTQYRMHANNLRKFNTRVCEIKCESISVFMQCESNDDVESMNLTENVVSCNCAVVYDHDVDFGELVVIDPPSFKNITERLPSKKITPEKLSHLTPLQRRELLEVLDRYPEVFSEVPGLCSIIEHRIPIRYDFQPKRLKAYKVPEHLKAEVARQIRELEQLGFIEKSTSPMASPIVCVLKAKEGKQRSQNCH